MFWYFFVVTLLCHFPLDSKGGGFGFSEEGQAPIVSVILLTSSLMHPPEIKQRDENYILQLIPSDMSEQKFIIMEMFYGEFKFTVLVGYYF